MVKLDGPPVSAIRNKPIAQELEVVLRAAAEASGVDHIQITSGGQDAKGHGTRRTGSTRHDLGRAADLQLRVNGTTLTFTDKNADPTVAAFVTAAAAAGATGIGAGLAYMGNRTLHVGFGTSPADSTRLTWGAGGKAVNAPQWLRDAAEAGWAAPAAGVAATSITAMGVAAAALSPGRYVVMARHGLKLRGGPGQDFNSERTLSTGTELTVVAVAPDPAWVQVDVEGDGLIDGFVFASFLESTALRTGEAVEEPELELAA